MDATVFSWVVGSSAAMTLGADYESTNQKFACQNLNPVSSFLKYRIEPARLARVRREGGAKAVVIFRTQCDRRKDFLIFSPVTH